MVMLPLAPNQHPARVLLLGSNCYFLKAASDLLSRYSHLAVVGGFRIEEQALARATMLQPEVVLVDLDAANGDGLLAVAGLRRSLPGVGIIALTLADDSAYDQAAQQAGADELVGKARLVTDLLPAIGRVSKRKRRLLSKAG